MADRRPQINFQVDESMKTLYQEARMAGHWVTRFCAAGLLLMVEDETVRRRALNRLREWEAEYEGADADQIREFVQGAQDAMRDAPPGNRRAPKARRVQKKAKRS